MSNNKYILFYSKYCKYSGEFIVALRKVDLYDKFVKLDVSETRVRQKLPRSITSVPSIIIPQYEEPLNYNDAMRWIEMLSKEREKKEEIEPYYATAMGGFSEAYSSLSDETPMSHAFEFLGNEFKINAPVEDGGDDPRRSSSSSGKKNEFESNLERLTRQRDLDITQEIKRI